MADDVVRLPRPQPDSALLNKLVRICVDADDLPAAAFLSARTPEPDFAQCARCLTPLLPGRTCEAASRPGRVLVLACKSCGPSGGAELRLPKDEERLRAKTKKRKLAEKPQEAVVALPPTATVKTPTSTGGSKQPTVNAALASVRSVKAEVAAARPLTLIEQAELRKREEKKKKKTEAAAQAPKSSLNTLAKALQS